MLTGEEFRKEFKKRLRDLVDSLEISKTKCAKEIGISYGTFLDIYNNGKIPRINTVVKIARYFNVSTDYILVISEKKEIKKKKH